MIIIHHNENHDPLSLLFAFALIPNAAAVAQQCLKIVSMYNWTPFQMKTCERKKQCRSKKQMQIQKQCSYPPSTGRSCCWVSCPPDSRSPAPPPREGSGCCNPCFPRNNIMMLCIEVYVSRRRNFLHLLATPAEKSWMDEVSWAPVRRRSLSWKKSKNLNDVRCLRTKREKFHENTTNLSLLGIICLDVPHMMPEWNIWWFCSLVKIYSELTWKASQ